MISDLITVSIYPNTNKNDGSMYYTLNFYCRDENSMYNHRREIVLYDYPEYAQWEYMLVDHGYTLSITNVFKYVVRMEWGLE